MTLGAEVAFRFNVSHFGYEPRSGRGIVVATEDYSVWPVGCAVRVAQSPDYPEGTIVHVSSSSIVAAGKRR